MHVLLLLGPCKSLPWNRLKLMSITYNLTFILSSEKFIFGQINLFISIMSPKARLDVQKKLALSASKINRGSNFVRQEPTIILQGNNNLYF